MKDIASLLPKNLHHAYVIEGGESIKEQLLQYVEDSLGMKTRGNPDIYIREHDVFGIADGREIQRFESNRPIHGDKKIFILLFKSVTLEAQNSLLKTFEEPTVGTHFFIITPSSENLLKTLLSRVHVIQGTEKNKAPSIFAKKFLASHPADRLALIADIIESKDKHEAIELVNGLEVGLYKHNHTKRPAGTISSQDEIAFESLRDVRSYLNDRSSSVKILLEHLSVTLPRIT